MIARTLAGLAAVFTPALALAAPLNLANYAHVATFALPAVSAAEASAVTYNWDTGSLFVLGDEGDALAEVSTSGVELGVMTLTGFDDTEGLTYLGSGQLVLVEERLRDAYLLSFSAGGSVDRSALSTADLGTTVGNIGIEGISYDTTSGTYFTVKETSPQEVNQATISFGAPGTAVVTSLFAPSLGVTDLSDVQVLSRVTSLTGTPDQENLLIYSQESRRLLEVSRAGGILSQFDFRSLSTSAEGVTIDGAGTIYLVDESPNLYVLRPVPEPLALISCAAGLVGTLLIRSVRRFPRRLPDM
jgi:hypothetical protein